MRTSGARTRSQVRVDGPAKVTGTATYPSDLYPANLAHAAVVTSDVARGQIEGFDLDHASETAGVLAIFTYHELADAIHPVKHLMAGGFANSSALPLESPEIHYAGQIVALVVADSPETAREAAFRIRVRYRREEASSLLGEPGTDAVPLSSVSPGHSDPARGDARTAFADAPYRVDATYRTPIQHHNPIELYGTTCAWEGDHLTIYEATRYVAAVQHGVAAQLAISADNIRVICPYMGGHFGSRLALSQYTAPVAIAARRLNRPVRFIATRAQCFTIQNHRPDTRHRIRIGATQRGEFTALLHEAEVSTSRFDNFMIEGTDVTASLYAWRNVETSETLVHVDRNTPGPMRAPPEVPYLFALESALDELAVQLSIDPIELRRRNDTAVDQITGKSFAPRVLMECFDTGAKSFGWSARNPKPRSMREGDWLIGYGCASAVRPVKQAAATMRIILSADGRATVETAHHEIGNGIYTVLAVQASQRLGVPVESVTVRLGDTALPVAGLSGGSSTTTSLLPVLANGCEQIRDRLARAALSQSGPLDGLSPAALHLENGFLVALDGRTIELTSVFALLGHSQIETLAEGAPAGTDAAQALANLREGHLMLAPADKNLRWAQGAQFVEVRVHSLTGEIRVARHIGAFSAGYIVNHLTAVSQLQGGMVWGLGSALLEATALNAPDSRYTNDNLADYLVATAADLGITEAILLHSDAAPSELMGLGELGIIGVNAAIANALYHATGKRCRSLPIHMENMLDS